MDLLTTPVIAGLLFTGTACVVGSSGEYEPANALLTETVANPVRKALGGGRHGPLLPWKRGGPGVGLDIPLAKKDAPYVRSLYDTFTVMFPDTSQASSC